MTLASGRLFAVSVVGLVDTGVGAEQRRAAQLELGGAAGGGRGTDGRRTGRRAGSGRQQQQQDSRQCAIFARCCWDDKVRNAPSQAGLGGPVERRAQISAAVPPKLPHVSLCRRE